MPSTADFFISILSFIVCFYILPVFVHTSTVRVYSEMVHVEHRIAGCENIDFDSSSGELSDSVTSEVTGYEAYGFLGCETICYGRLVSKFWRNVQSPPSAVKVTEGDYSETFIPVYWSAWCHCRNCNIILITLRT